MPYLFTFLSFLLQYFLEEELSEFITILIYKILQLFKPQTTSVFRVTKMSPVFGFFGYYIIWGGEGVNIIHFTPLFKRSKILYLHKDTDWAIKVLPR